MQQKPQQPHPTTAKHKNSNNNNNNSYYNTMFVMFFEPISLLLSLSLYFLGHISDKRIH